MANMAWILGIKTCEHAGVTPIRIYFEEHEANEDREMLVRFGQEGREYVVAPADVMYRREAP